LEESGTEDDVTDSASDQGKETSETPDGTEEEMSTPDAEEDAEPSDVEDAEPDTTVDGEEDIPPVVPTYWTDIKPIIDSRCAACHYDGGIGPFPLTTYEETYEARELVRWAVNTGKMPPWQAEEGCRDYGNDI